MAKTVKISFALAFMFSMTILCFVTACSNISKDGTAAVVNDVKISEDQVTQKVMDYRTQNKLTDDDEWAKYLKDKKTSAKKIRADYLDKLIELELYRQIAQEKGIVATNDDMLVSLVNQRLVREAPTPKDAYSKLLVLYGDKLNGSKGYYQLMFKNSEEDKAEQVLTQIKSGQLSFQDAIAQRLKEDADGVNFDYVIYDCMIVNPDPCPQVLGQLHTGQISDLVKTKDYIYIFDVVDEISCGVPLTSFSSLSDFTQENLKFYSKILDAQNIALDAFDKIKKQASITKYDMPTDLPY